MKFFNLKLAITILAVFGLLLAGFAVYPKLRLKWLARSLHSADPAEFENAVKKLFSLGEEGRQTARAFFERPDSRYSKPVKGVVMKVTPAAFDFRNKKLWEEMRFRFEIRNLSSDEIIFKWADWDSLVVVIKGMASEHSVRQPWIIMDPILGEPRLNPGECNNVSMTINVRRSLAGTTVKVASTGNLVDYSLQGDEWIWSTTIEGLVPLNRFTMTLSIMLSNHNLELKSLPIKVLLKPEDSQE